MKAKDKIRQRDKLILLNVAEAHLYSCDIDMSRAVNGLMEAYSDEGTVVARAIQNMRFELGKLRQRIRKEITRVIDQK